jgi:hypothetical protein
MGVDGGLLLALPLCLLCGGGREGEKLERKKKTRCSWERIELAVMLQTDTEKREKANRKEGDAIVKESVDMKKAPDQEAILIPPSSLSIYLYLSLSLSIDLYLCIFLSLTLTSNS